MSSLLVFSFDCRDVLAEIDNICGGFIRNSDGSMKTFFDICCAPGE